MMPSKNRVGQIIKMKATTLTLISLTLRLGFILTSLDDFIALTLGTVYPLRPSDLAYCLIAFSILNQAGKVKHLRQELTLFQVF